MAERQESTRDSLGMLDALTAHVEQSVTMVREKRANLEKARATPGVLDDATVARVKRMFGQTAEDAEMFAEQGRQWAAEGITPDQRDQVECYAALVTELQRETTAVLALADELAKGAIETVLAKSDIELGIEAFLRGDNL
ncbi:hypothetical protein SAMN05216276_103564 [Streptosporangium subroseum]|uniref:Uncharacterized protein n=1 Tax=Streptosporangium subroseum TaxID=106412 RepID=A0A239LVB1_9ACTN|nr:hypothetical protein [Streptosporangium subroseum]SNT34315.1 hypothetical protein SAMN05216276_103564 [Streptosporangium subroseum]